MTFLGVESCMIIGVKFLTHSPAEKFAIGHSLSVTASETYDKRQDLLRSKLVSYTLIQKRAGYVMYIANAILRFLRFFEISMMLHPKRFTSLSFFDIVTSFLSWFPKAIPHLCSSQLAKLYPQTCRPSASGWRWDTCWKYTQKGGDLMYCNGDVLTFSTSCLNQNFVQFDQIQRNPSVESSIIGYSSLTDYIYIYYYI